MIGAKFNSLSNKFLQSNVSHRTLNRFLHRHLCSITSSEYLRKLNSQKLTKKEVENLIRDRAAFEERLAALEEKLDSSNFEKIISQPPRAAASSSLAAQFRQTGATRSAPLFIERVGEKKWQSFFTTIVFWVILLSLWFHFQRGQNSIQNMFDDNYTEYDEIHWEDEESESDTPGGLNSSETEKPDQPKEW